MFTQRWRRHWGLTEDPFACEDADKDHILGAVDAAAVHSGFDRIFGNPRVPAPAIVFGEKGSGKSGIRRMMKRRIDAHNHDIPEEKTFTIEYIDFDPFIEQFRQAIGAPDDPRKAAARVLARWSLADHLDAILSLGVTSLVDRVLGPAEIRPEVDRLSRKQRRDLTLLGALYYFSRQRTTAEAVSGLQRVLGIHGVRKGTALGLALVGTAAGAILAALPFLGLWELGSPTGWLGAGAGVVAGTWLAYVGGRQAVARKARRAIRSLNALPRDAAPLRHALESLPRKERAEYGLPIGMDEGTRYDLVDRFLGILRCLGYGGCYVLLDRVDEPSLLSGNAESMRRFVETLLDIKLLQYPGLALKLFLPIEMETIYRSASPEDLKRMRLDKSNLIPELQWTGEELYEIASQRLLACMDSGRESIELGDLFADDVDPRHLRDTFHALGTPRYAFGFLSAVLLEYIRDLPNDLGDDDPRWRVPLAHFEVIRAMWVDRAGLLRRSLN